MAATQIPGYRYGDPSLPPSALSLGDLHRIQQALLFSEEDVRALR